MRSKLGLLVCLLLSACLPIQAQRTIHVPTDAPTIQAGIDAANTGDTVLVAPGTYTENIDFKGKAITVTSSGGAPKTIIDGQQKSPAVLFLTSETRASILSGFTIQHGGAFGYSYIANGGIAVQNSSPTIRNNVLTQNTCWTIYAVTAAPLIENNEISATQDPQGQCSFGGGAGVYIEGNLNGSAATNDGSSAMIVGNTIEKNVESGLEDAGGNGGAGIAVWGGSPIIMNNTIRNNASPGGSGGAINVESGFGVAIVQNLIYGNSAGCGGGALAVQANQDERTGIADLVANNTIVNNTDGGQGGYSECISISQIYPDPDSYGEGKPSELFINNIISGSTSYPAVNCSWFDPGNPAVQPEFENDILYNAGGSFFGSYCVDVSAEYNNIVADPQFVNASGSDFHLRNTSPAIDHGQNAVLQLFQSLTGLTLSTDFDGNARVQDTAGKGCAIDMGAYEYPGSKDICSTEESLVSSLNPSTFGQTVTFTAQLSSANGVPTGDVQFSDGSTVLGAEAVSATGAATFSISTLSVGSHPITAAYQPTGSFPAATANLTQVVNALPTSLTLTSSLNPSTYAQPVTFTAHVTTTSTTATTPTGTITFLDGNTTLATVPLDTSGTASYTISTLTASPNGATHPITAQYTSTDGLAPASAILLQLVNGLPSSTTLTVTPLTGASTDTYTMVATVTNSSGNPISTPPSGTVNFYFNDYGASANYATLVNGVATFKATDLNPGQNIVVASFHGDSVFAPSSSNTVVLNINGQPTTLTLTASSNPTADGVPVTFTLHLSENGSAPPAGIPLQLTIGSSAPVTLTTDANGNATYSSLTPVGPCTVSASFSGKDNLLPSAATLTENTTAPVFSLYFTAAPNPAFQGQAVTLTAVFEALQVSTAQVPAGTYTFYDGLTALGTATLSASGQATLTTTTLAVGTHTLTATYTTSGSVITSGPVQETILPSSFAITLTPATLTLHAGQQATTTVNLNSIGAFAGPLTLSSGPLPTYASAAFTPATTTLTAGNGATATLLITTSQAPTKTASNNSTPKPWLFAFAPLCLLPFARARRLRQVLTVLVAAILLQTLTTGCGTVGFPFYLVAPGTYQVPITATDNANNQRSATLTIVITP